MTDLQEKSAERIEERIAGQAAEARPRYKAVTVCKDVTFDLLLTALATAPLTHELPVKSSECGLLRCKLIDIPLDGLTCDLRVEFGEDHSQ